MRVEVYYFQSQLQSWGHVRQVAAAQCALRWATKTDGQEAVGQQTPALLRYAKSNVPVQSRSSL